jgi:hypothetical protein
VDVEDCHRGAADRVDVAVGRDPDELERADRTADRDLDRIANAEAEPVGAVRVDQIGISHF